MSTPQKLTSAPLSLGAGDTDQPALLDDSAPPAKSKRAIREGEIRARKKAERERAATYRGKQKEQGLVQKFIPAHLYEEMEKMGSWTEWEAERKRKEEKPPVVKTVEVIKEVVVETIKEVIVIKTEIKEAAQPTKVKLAPEPKRLHDLGRDLDKLTGWKRKVIFLLMKRDGASAKPQV